VENGLWEKGGSSRIDEEAGAIAQVGTDGGNRDGEKRMELRST